MRTTCVATRLSGGHANNALPQTATANVNCRILPSHSQEEIRQQLIQIFNDPKVTVRYVNDAGEVMDTAPDSKAVPPTDAAARSDAAFGEAGGADVARRPGDSRHGNGRIGRQILPARLACRPTASTGSRSISMMFARTARMSGVAVDSYYRGVEFYYRYVKLLSGGK